MEENANSIEKTSDLGQSPQRVAKRWKLELGLANKREANWRKKAKEIYNLYTPDNPLANSFNILWTNTETLRQSVYNSLPQPDARRRYQDEDPLGKQVGDVLTRALEYSQDTYDFDGLMKEDVLAMLLAGRAVSRVRYLPKISMVEKDVGPESDEAEVDAEPDEKIDWEQACADRIQWDDFRILCAAKTWAEVTAVGFRHRFTRQDCVDKFGEEIGNKIGLDNVDDEDVNKSKVSDLFKTAEVWEIWNKDDKEVIWICPTYEVPCKIQKDPLKLSEFFPIPKPLYAIENDSTLVPAALYTQYEQQAKELNKVSKRINVLMDALKVRGVYDSTMGELANLMNAGDNEFIPGENITALLERGGIEAAIWFMPIKEAAEVIKVLFEQREATKQVIYEITGISDIMRSASDPNETFGAQKIKTQWGTQRLQRMQKEVQRYIRDLIRIKAEIISEKFQMETLEQMTLIELPHQDELDQKKAQLMQQAQQYQMTVQQAQSAGQQPPPPPPGIEKLQQPMPISWEKVMETLRNDATRSYHVDIETDSTLSATQDADMDAMQQLLTGITNLVQGLGPAVQSGAMPIEAVKEIIMAVCRRAKMGSAVEDALNKMQQPAPEADPEQAKADAEKAKVDATMQLEQFKAELADQSHQRQLEADAQAEARSADLQAKLQAHEQEMQAQQNQHQQELEAMRDEQAAQREVEAEERRLFIEEQAAQRDELFNRWKAELEAAVKIEIANISSKAKLQDAATEDATAEVAREVQP